MAVTYRQMLNRVLRTLGEDEIGASVVELTTDYDKLVGNFLNQIKEEIEDATNWRSLRNVLTATIAVDALSGTVVGSNERSRILRGDEVTWAGARGLGFTPLVFDVTDSNSPTALRELELTDLLYRDTIDPTTRTSADVQFFAVDDRGGDELTIHVWPRPSTERTLSAIMVVPQARLTDTDLDTVIVIPTRALEVGTLWYALEERGEELGINALFSEERYRNALNDAVSRDTAEQGGIDLVLV